MSIEKLKELSKSFVLPEDILEKRENDRLSFVSKFPLNRLKELSIDDFVQGTDENSFCYWLEFKKIGFGIGGGNASKFGIYKTKNKGEEVYATGSGKNKIFLNDKEANDYFTELLNKILIVLDYAKNDEIEKIKELNIPMWNMVLQKILTNYYPSKFLSIGSPSVLIKCAQEMDIKEVELSSENSIQINYECNKAFTKDPQFSNWPNEKLGSFIWETFNGDDKKKNRKESKQYWLYAPGENAYLWDEFYQDGIMALGWDEIGDLKQFKNRTEIKKALVDAYGGTGSKKNDVSANDDFLNKINIGDIVIVKKGRGELLGYGIVTSDYFYDKSRENYKHVRQVDWNLKGNWNVDFHLVLKTLTDVTKYSSDHPNYDTYYERLLGIMGVGETLKDYGSMQNHEHYNISYPLNTIFYGPPGTGKTYNTINESLNILGENISNLTRKEIKLLFKKKLEEGRIVFTTFHQSMSYEDFIEGIKPQTKDEGISYVIEDGIFKQLCYKSIYAHYSTSNHEVVNYNAFDNLYSSYIENVESRLNELKNDRRLLLPLKTDGYFTEIKNINQDEDYILTRGTMANYDVKVFKERLRKLYIRFKSIEDIKDVNTDIRSVGKGLGWSSNYYGVFKDIKEFEKVNFNKESIKTTEIISYSDYDKIKNFISNSNMPKKFQDNADKFILIIDEINRGSVSQIFGELITLLETDKRLGKPEELTLTLPYSKSVFGVPPNLYVLGTMNTADRSIEALDTALRRRFSFTEMPPKPELVKTESKLENGIINKIDLSIVLGIINKRIEKLLDKDHMIGHSYFLTVESLKDLKSAFSNKIVPLLQEYFYGDYGKIGLVIGPKFFDIQNNQFEDDFFAPFEDYDSSPFVEKKVYHLKNIEQMSDEIFIDALIELQGKSIS